MFSTNELLIVVSKRSDPALIGQLFSFNLDVDAASKKDRLSLNITNPTDVIEGYYPVGLWKDSLGDMRYSFLVSAVARILESPHAPRFIEELFDVIPVAEDKFQAFPKGFSISWNRWRSGIAIASTDLSDTSRTGVTLNGETAFEILGYYLTESARALQVRTVLEGMIEIYESLLRNGV